MVWTTNNVYESILKELTLWYPKETGGVLMGYKKDGDFWITQSIGPGPKAIHQLRSFTPDNDFHETEIARVYSRSLGEITYLGDWHTHPRAAAYLSELDKTAMRNISRYKPSRLPEPLMMILGTLPLEIKCWKYNKRAFNYGTSQHLTVGLYIDMNE